MAEPTLHKEDFYYFIPDLGLVVDKKRPDKYGIIGALISVMGVLIMFYIPRY